MGVSLTGGNRAIGWGALKAGVHFFRRSHCTGNHDLFVFTE